MNGCSPIGRLILAAGLALGWLPMREAARADPPKAATAATSIVLPPVAVMGKPVSSFGLSLRLLRSEATQRTLLATVTDVEPGSDAQRKGIGTGTAILGIDGIDIHDFRATFAHGSELNAKLLQRRPGDHVTLEILPLGTSKPRFVTLVEGHRNDREADAGPLDAKHIGLSGSRP